MVGANAVFKVDMVGFAFAPTLVRKPFAGKRKTVLKWSIDELKRAKKLAVRIPPPRFRGLKHKAIPIGIEGPNASEYPRPDLGD